MQASIIAWLLAIRTPANDQKHSIYFQNTSSVKALVAHPVCMSHGLTLTAADTIVWFSPTTSLETFEQANARIRRIGQRHRQQIIMLQSTPAERAIYARLRSKRDAQNNVLELTRKSHNGATHDH